MRRFAPILVALLAITAGCVAPSGPTAPALADTGWVVTAIKNSPTLAERQPTMTFTAAEYRGTTGCNSFGGEFTQAGSTVKLGSAAVTAMACLEEPIMTQEARFLAVLGEVASITATANRVDLLDASGHSVLSLAQAPTPSPRALIATTWTLTGFRSGGTSSSVVADSTVTLTMTQTNYTGKACNTFGGDLTTTGDKITFGTPRSTKMACRSPELSAQESSVLATLATITTWKVTGTSLALSAPDGSGLDFIAS